MPTLTFSWKFFLPQDTTPYVLDDGADTEADWISSVQWRTQARDLMPEKPQGLYIIQNTQNSPIYAGKSKNIRERFGKRSKVLTEYKVSVESTLDDYSVWLTSVVSKPPQYPDKITYGERWVVRFLVLLDERDNNPRLLQNILLTSAFSAPADGLTITFDKRQAPPYLNDDEMNGYAGEKNNIVTYRYKAKSIVLP